MLFGLLEHAGVGLGDHLLAVVDPDQVLLEDVVVEHVLGGLAEVDDPLPEVRRLHAVRHVLRVAGAGRVVVAADAADAAGDEVRVARVLALHEDRVAAEDRAGAVALGDLPVAEVDLGVDAEAADDPGDRVPRHLDEAVVVRRSNLLGLGMVDVMRRLAFRSVDAGAGSASPGARGAGGELRALGAPLRLLVERLRGDLAQPLDGRAVEPDRVGGELAAGRLVHERHELVGEARHRAADADAADVGAAADAVDPAALGHVALHDRPPAAELDDALRGAVLGGEVGLLVVAGAVAALVHGAAEQPGGPQRVVERDHRRLAGGHVEQVGQRLGQVVRLDRAAGHADDRDAGLGLPVPAEVVGHAHRAGRVAGHGVDAAVGRAGADRDDGGGLGGEPVEPLAGGHRLAGRRVVAEPAPVALVVQLLVGDRALDHQHERLELAAVGLEEPLEEVVGAAGRAALEVDQRPVHRHLRQPGKGAEGDLLDAGLGGRGQRDGVTVAAEPGVDPQHVDECLLGLYCLGCWHRAALRGRPVKVPCRVCPGPRGSLESRTHQRPPSHAMSRVRGGGLRKPPERLIRASRTSPGGSSRCGRRPAEPARLG